MQAISIPAPGGPDVLTPVVVDTPVPRPGEVLIRVAAAGVNGPDISQRKGAYAPPPDASPLPGLEVSGVIAGLGEEQTRFRTGDPVVALCNGGGYAEYVAVPAGQVLARPESWDWAQAATLPETFFTIQQTLVERARLSSGLAVLVHGGAGGIGATAIQMARLFGATPMIATVSSAEKADYARAMGAETVIDYTREDFVAAVLEATGGKGADIIVDIVGGDYADRNIRAAARNGHILQLATRGGTRAEVNLGLVLMKALTLSGSTLRPQSPATKARFAAGLHARVWPAIAAGHIKPPRIRSFALAEAAEAHRAMEGADHYGKIVLLTDFGRHSQ